jgi:hypothetical protein
MTVYFRFVPSNSYTMTGFFSLAWMMPFSAVAMMSGPTLMQRPVAGVGKLGFTKPPALGLSRPSLRSGSSKPEVSFGVTEEWSAMVSPSLWNVKCEDLEMVPLDFPLERTHREIQDTKASVVSSRIANALRCLSIEAEYDDEKAKAKCKSSDLVYFRIRLYSGGENGQPVVVEVQRRCGSASSFMHSCRAILNSAEGKGVEGALAMKKVPPFMKKPIGQMRCLQSVIPKDENVEEVSIAELDCVMNMLRSKQRDSNVLGLENLCCITDPVKTKPLVAIRVSKCVVLGDEKYDVREEIRALTERDVFDPEEFNSKHAEHLRHLSLAVFANALSTCSNDGCLSTAVKEQRWFEDHLIPLLIDELKRAPLSACIAYRAASCIHSLLVCSDVARLILEKNGGVEALGKAYKFGVGSHELLASETLRCLKVIEEASHV